MSYKSASSTATKQSSKPSSEPSWLTIARGEIGQKEVIGKMANPRILEYFTKTSYQSKSDETSWCSAAMCWVMEKAGIKSTRRANARSWMKWGVGLEKFRVGCIVVFWRGSKDSWMGHVGLGVAEDEKYIWVLGGNQGNAFNIKKYPKAQLLGMRWPSK